METKEGKYQLFVKQIASLFQGEKDKIANLSNFSAAYFEQFQPHWVGFYLVKNKELVLGPFQGPVACTRISFGKGVCGTAWKDTETVIVDNVHEFAGHIACSPHSNSEIVVPFMKNGECIGVFDVDSSSFNLFDAIDKKYLEQAMVLLSESIDWE